MENVITPWDQLIDALNDGWGWLIIVSVLSCLGFIGMTVAQFVKCLWTKNTTSLNKFYTIILPITNTLITFYNFLLFAVLYADKTQEVAPGVPFFNWAAFLPALLNGLISAYGTMILKIKHVNEAKRLGISEMEHYLKYLKPKAMSTKKAKKKKK